MPVDPSKIDPDLLYTFREAAALAHVAKRTVEGWRERRLFEPAGGVRGTRRCLYIRGSDLLRIVVGEEKPPPLEIESPARRRQREAATNRYLREQGLLA